MQFVVIMSTKMMVVLSGSLLLNLAFVGGGSAFLSRHGGIGYLTTRLKGSAPTLAGETYFNERRHIFSQLPRHEGAIVFLGDSLTERCPWNELLQRNDIISRGIGGEDIDGVSKNVAEVARHKPKRIFVMAGTNDLIEGKKTEEITTRYQQLIADLGRQSPCSVLVVQSVLPMNERAFPNSSEQMAREQNRSVNQQVVEINKRLQKMADGRKVIFCDVAAVLKKGDQLDDALSSDGQHLNAQGYAKWKQVVLPLLGDTA